jgi:hypothetical protein
MSSTLSSRAFRTQKLPTSQSVELESMKFFWDEETAVYLSSSDEPGTTIRFSKSLL